MIRRPRKRSWSVAFLSLIILLTAVETHAFQIGRIKTELYSLTEDAEDARRALYPSMEPNADTDTDKPKLRRQRQVRRKPVDRRPRYFWLDPVNLRRELCQFWANCGVQTTDRRRPAIPNEVLLMHYERHDLRAAIAKNGGRESVSELLGGAPIMPGQWKKAVASSKELQHLLQLDASLTPERPPRVITSSAVDPVGSNNDTRWLHHDGRNRKGYWSLQTVVQELYVLVLGWNVNAVRVSFELLIAFEPLTHAATLPLLVAPNRDRYEYVDRYKVQHNRPSVWMPRPSEMAAEGRDDLRQAMNRFGGARGICRTAGMVPYGEWYYFEGQLELLVELKRYLDEFASSNYKSFPTVSDIQRNGYEQLHALIQYYGGRKFLAARLNMSEQSGGYGNRNSDVENSNANRNGYSTGSNTGMKFGSFDLDFAVRLLTFVREDQMKRNPPLQNPVLAMPSRSKVLSQAEDGAWLDAKIDEFGGYENVARRLGLALFATESWNGRLH